MKIRLTWLCEIPKRYPKCLVSYALLIRINVRIISSNKVNAFRFLPCCDPYGLQFHNLIFCALGNIQAYISLNNTTEGTPVYIKQLGSFLWTSDRKSERRICFLSINDGINFRLQWGHVKRVWIEDDWWGSSLVSRSHLSLPFFEHNKIFRLIFVFTGVPLTGVDGVNECFSDGLRLSADNDDDPIHFRLVIAAGVLSDGALRFLVCVAWGSAFIGLGFSLVGWPSMKCCKINLTQLVPKFQRLFAWNSFMPDLSTYPIFIKM